MVGGVALHQGVLVLLFCEWDRVEGLGGLGCGDFLVWVWLH